LYPAELLGTFGQYLFQYRMTDAFFGWYCDVCGNVMSLSTTIINNNSGQLAVELFITTTIITTLP
jgi:hypothetical protein